VFKRELKMEAITMPLAQVDASSMQAILQSGYGSTDVLRLGETVRPRPVSGEVLVRVEAAGLDRGTWHLMTGRPYLMRLMGFGFSAPKNPVCGLDLAGTVIEVGEGVTRFRVGDAVFGIGRGTFAQFACASEDKLVHKPQNLSFEEAAVLAVSGITAVQALREAGQLRAGERVLIIGASGGVGSYALQLAKAYGATVTAVCTSSKVERVRALGADHVIDRMQRDFADGSSQYDLILDIGGNTPLARLRRAMTPNGRLVFVGGEHGGDWTAGFGRQLYASLLGLFVQQRFVNLMSREHWEPMQELATLAEQGKLRPLIDRRCALSEVPAALNDLEAGNVCGKVIVRVA
jgi:NADPH:quinone reductase-like Zn-dependent oxidoreductase